MGTTVTGFRNLDRGSATGARSELENFGVATPTFGHVKEFIKHTIIVVASYGVV